MYFERRAKEWYDQLDDEVKKDWKLLKKSFKEFYLSSEHEKSKPAAYYQASQYKYETAIEFLMRFNTLAKRARIDYKDDKKSAREHVRNFLAALKDQELSSTLPNYRIKSADELYEILREQKLATARRKGEPKNDFKFKDVDRKKSEANRVRFTALKKNEQKHRSYDPSSDSDNGNSTGSETSTAECSDDEYVHHINGEQHKSKNNRCNNCGSGTHNSNNCWKTVKCEACNLMGHPTDRCFKICKTCSKVHENGDCIYKKLGEWVQNNGIDDLPEQFKQCLN
jgi:hypothetical protein